MKPNEKEPMILDIEIELLEERIAPGVGDEISSGG